ncbi:MAG TPA: phospholipase D-like domain-containing protein [Vicinamibacterales bacterium]|nr:phospholipase D-like domain-containing protein [Vicinamibacterales bacterium]
MAGPRRTPVTRIVTSLADRRDTILDVIRNAKREISLSLFRCNDDAVFDALADAASRGVAVNALVTSRAKGGPKKLKKLWDALQATGASIAPYTDPVVKYHAKYLIVDDATAVVASCNLTRKCFSKTVDAIVVTQDQDIIDGLRTLMSADRAGQRAPDSVTEKLIIGPERARRQFTTLIEGATSRIRLIDPKLSDPDVMALLNQRRAAGLPVDVFGAKRVGDLKSHGKIMLIDDRVAVVGSLALAALSLDFRREVAIIVDEPDAVAEVQRLFETVASPQQVPA